MPEDSSEGEWIGQHGYFISMMSSCCFWGLFLAFCSTWFVAVICLRIGHPCLFFFLFFFSVSFTCNGNVSCPGFIDRMSL